MLWSKAYIVVVLLLSLSICTFSQAPVAKPPSKPPGTQPPFPTLDEILWWFPEDTETLFVARGPFRLIRSTMTTPLERQLEKELQFMMFGGIMFGDEDDIPPLIMNSNVLLAVEGSRNFREPSSLGDMPFDGCDVIVFGGDFAKKRETLLKEYERQAQRKQVINGHQVFITEQKLEEDTWTILIANPKPNIFLVATNEQYLTTMLRRMTEHGANRALPDSLPEWAHVDRSARFFALRHFSRSSPDDPSSPYGGRRAANVQDEQAIGLALSYSATQGRALSFTYLSDNKDALNVAKSGWPNGWEDLRITHVQKKPGVIRVSFAFKDDEEISMTLFMLLGSFGHGTYV